MASAEESNLLLTHPSPSSPFSQRDYASASSHDDDSGDFHRLRRMYSEGNGHYTMKQSYLSAGSSRHALCVPLLLAGLGITIGVFSFYPLVAEQRSLHSRLSTAGLPLLGSRHDEPSVLDEDYKCKRDDSYSKNTLKGAYDLPYAALFRDTRGEKKFEASAVTIVNDEVYSVCDSSWAISKFTRELSPFSKENVLIGDPDRKEEEDSGYEAIFEHEGLFYVVRESVFHEGHDHDDGDYHAIIEELDLHDDDYTVVRECRCEFTFEGDSKGFEGAVGFPDENDQLYILGLCEGNHCSEKRKKKNDVGNGRVVLMKKAEEEEDDDGSPCLWETVRVINIPESAAFLDYSAIDITANGRVAITSQEGSAVWLGHASGISDGVIDPDAFEFNDDDDDSSSVLQFPKDGSCHTIYCNIEGIHFMNDDMLMAVSDKMKSKGRQSYRCHEKDQSIHAFVIP
eukprot:CAMPEP_0183767226 /NCGR_PEP_ID=MMETSP0739-20130205/12058_1 /TAXON_ID=385413 /ORGANISM="Thalassiosira miniscula, Strain CCMP1093" /LENGTH=453 /DNA_ID=CAMNT_0026006109 /DNA_START=7 /DNA_END=1368 /DNA_ORIENTATION=+